MEFDEVIEKSHDVKSFNENVRAYFEERELTKEEKRKHFWALHYEWREKLLKKQE